MKELRWLCRGEGKRYRTVSSLFLVVSIIVFSQFALPVRAAERQVVHVRLPAAATHLQPLGRLGGAKHLQLAIGLPLRNQKELSNLLQEIYDPASPNYRHFLTPGQFTERFGPSEQDYQAVIAFAQTHGLKVTGTSPNRLLVDVNGSVADIEKALHITLQVYQHPTEARTFYAPDGEPSLDLAVPILGISGLNNYSLPKPRFVAQPLAKGQAMRPNAGSGPSGTYLGNDFRAAYVPDTTLTGTGQAVGLLQFDGYTASDITYYESQAGLPNVTLTNVLIDGATGNPSGSGGEVEVSLDIEMAISMAPGLSQVIVYEAPNPSPFEDLLNRMASDDLAKQLSCSWYIPNGVMDTNADGIFQEMAAQGQSFFSASGDSDAFTGLIDFPGDTPYITQVGGTTLSTSGPGGSWTSETVWNWGNGIGSGGGISTQYPIPDWQTNINMTANQGSTTMRNTPDVALTADNVYVRADGQDYNVGGTSCAAPLWAGFAALVNQQATNVGKPPIGFINPAVDTIGTGPDYTSAFHDITTGNNTSPSSPTKFYAVAGYDLCTGWGTPAGQKLIDALVPPVIVTLPASATEGDGLLAGAGQVQLPAAQATNVVVGLSSSDPAQVSVPVNVTVPAGQSNAAFDLTILDDGVLDGTRIATITASAPGIGSGSASMTIFDKETATLQVLLPATVTKGQGAVQGTVEISAPVAADVAVALSSDATNLMKVPATVTIPSGQTSAVFTATVLTDGQINGGQTVNVTAHVQNWTDGTVAVAVQDNVNLTVTLPASAWENAGVLTNAGSVSLAGTEATDQVISLASDKPNKLTVPAAVTISAGSLSTTFNVTLVDNTIADGHQIVTVTASAPGFTNGSASMLVLDDESPPFPSNPRPGNLATNVPANTNLMWNNGIADTNQLFLNGGFESGTFTNWVKVNSGLGDWVINDGTYVPPGPGGATLPFAGSFSALSEQTGGGLHTIYQDILIPSGTTSATLSWVDQIRNFAPQFTTDSQYFHVEIRGTNDSLLQIAFTTQPGDPLTNDWTARSFDLSAYAGQTIRIAFVESDSLFYFNVGLDNISIQVNIPGTGSSGIITNDVYFGTNPTPGPAEFQGSTTNSSWTLPLLAPLTTYYWQIAAHRVGSATGPVWQFTTAGVDHFAWSAIPSPQLVNQPFNATITAKDAFNTTVTNFTGPVALQRLGNVSILNGGFEAGSLTNWTVVPSAYGRFVINNGAVDPPSPDGPLPPFAGGYSALGDENGGGVFDMYQDVSIPAGASSATLSWAHRVRNFYTSFSSLQQFQVLICDTNSNVLATAFTTNPGDPLLGDWVQKSYDLTSFAGQTVRVMFWVNSGSYYLDVHVDNVNVQANFPIFPTNSGNFDNGSWSGSLTVQQPAPNVVLVADDGSQHTGTSNPFDVDLANDIFIGIVDSPHPVSAEANLTYTLTVANTGPSIATGVTVTNILPANITFVSAASSQGTCAQNGGVVTGDLGVVPGGTNATIVIVVTPTVAGVTLTNVATVSRAEADSYLGNNTATATTPVTTPAISIADASVVEGNVGTTNMIFAVTLAVPSAQTITVNYATSDGSAIAGSDYVATNGVLTFPPGATNGTISVAVIGDILVETNETFFVNLSNPVNGVLGRAQAVGTIINDDGLPGNVDHFVWSAIASPQFAGQPFGVTLTALDYSNNVATNFNGVVSLNGVATNQVGTNMDFEAGTLAPWIPLNAGNQPGPYDLVTFDVNGDGISSTAFRIAANSGTPDGITQNVPLIGGATYNVKMDIATDDSTSGNNADGGTTTILIGGTTVAQFGWGGVSIGNIYRTNLVGTFTPPSNGIYAVTLTFYRGYFEAPDLWCLADDLRITGPGSSISIVPTTTANFTNGIWNGNITVQQRATNLVLRADDNSGHFGLSNPFDVAPANMPPIILLQPTNQMVIVGGSAVFAVGTDGTPPLNYQWNFNGTNISEATNTSLTLTNVQLSQAGNYAVLVTNLYGSVMSSNAVLTVVPPPSVPVITGFSPASGLTGISVTIFGTNFSPVAASNIVYFGAVQAAVTAASVTNLVVTVPAGATYAPITETVNGLTAYANQPFMPTFFGDGSGVTANSFAPQLVLPAGSGPIKVVIADLDGDGKPDLIVANDYGNTISLYRNISTNGLLTASSFAPPVNLVTPPGSYSPYGLAVADVDGDGRLDIIVSDYDESIVSVYRNTCTPGNISSNAFATRVDFATGAQPQGIEVRDLDGDGRPDLLVANSGDGSISILRNTGVMGSLTTNSFAPKVDIATGSGCDSVAVGDLDGDGKPDVVAINTGAGTVSLLRNTSTPGSITFAAKADITVLSGPVQVAIGDLDGDGKPDLTVTFYLPQTVSVLRNTSTVGSLTTNSFGSRIDFSLGGRGHTPAIADLDGDGKPDLAVVTELNSLLSIFRNVSTPGSFTNSSFANRVDFSTGYNAWGVSIGDLNDDGRPDIIFANSYDNTISIYQNVVPFGGPPVIRTQPTNQTVVVGDTATFSAGAGGSPPLSYQWFLNQTNLLAGQTNASLILTNVQLADSGSEFSCLVTNLYGSALSSNALLKVVETVPNDLCSGAIVIPGSTYTNTQSTTAATSSGDPVPDCIPGFGNGVWYQFTAPSNGVIIVDTFGSDFDTGLAAYTGSCGSLTEVACNDDTGGVTSQITLPVTAGVAYYFLAGGYSAYTGNLVIHLAFLAPPLIITQPANQTMVVGGTANFSVTAIGTPPLSYQWNFNGTNLAGATNPTLTLTNVQLNQAGNYTVLVTNLYGSALGSNAMLTVTLPPTNCDPAPSGLVAWWPGEGNADDVVGTNNGILQGGMSFGPGEVGQGFVFNGSNGYVSVPSSPSITPTGPFTVEGWINYRGLNPQWNGLDIIAKGQDIEGAIDWALTVSPNRKLRPHVQVGGNWVYFDCNTVLNTGIWYHVALVYDGAHLLGYVNGTLDGSQSVSGTLQATDNPLRIGAYAPVNGTVSKAFFNGMIDELSIYNRALLSNEIAAIYTAGNGGKCAPEPLTIFVQPDHKAVLLGCNVTFNALADGSGPLTYQWWKDGVALNLQTNMSLSLTNVQTSDFGSYSVVVSDAFESVTSSPALLSLGHPPVAYPDVIQRFAVGGVRVNASDLVTNDTDADGDYLTVIEVSSSSAAGGVVGLTNNWVYYAPPAGGADTDTFTYVVSDGGCGTDTGTVTVQIKPDNSQPLNFAVDNPNDGSVLVRFDGIPGFTYRIMYTDSLSAPDWQTLTTQTADGFGVCQFVDRSPTNAPARFYRAVWP